MVLSVNMNVLEIKMVRTLRISSFKLVASSLVSSLSFVLECASMGTILVNQVKYLHRHEERNITKLSSELSLNKM